MQAGGDQRDRTWVVVEGSIAYRIDDIHCCLGHWVAVALVAVYRPWHFEAWWSADEVQSPAYDALLQCSPGARRHGHPARRRSLQRVQLFPAQDANAGGDEHVDGFVQLVEPEDHDGVGP